MKKNEEMRLNGITTVLILLLCLFWFSVAGAARIGCIEGNCNDGQGVFVGENGRHYQGGFAKGLMSGKGVLTYPNGTLYSGEFQRGKFHGAGALTHPDGRKYNGHFFRGVIDGRGLMVLADGSEYNGDFSLGKFHGFGLLKMLNGTRYQGEFRNGMFEGEGTLVYPNDTWFKGNFHNGKPAGNGEMKYEDGSTYQGEFKGNKRHGYGVYRAADGTEYEGMFVQDVYQKENNTSENAKSMQRLNVNTKSTDWVSTTDIEKALVAEEIDTKEEKVKITRDKNKRFFNPPKKSRFRVPIVRKNSEAYVSLTDLPTVKQEKRKTYKTHNAIQDNALDISDKSALKSSPLARNPSDTTVTMSEPVVQDSSIGTMEKKGNRKNSPFAEGGDDDWERVLFDTPQKIGPSGDIETDQLPTATDEAATIELSAVTSQAISQDATYSFKNGVIIDQAGAKVTGEVKNIKLSSGQIYSGSVKKGVMNGVGLLSFKNGDSYMGQLKGGAINGQGTYIYADKRKYEGGFSGGKKSGEGVFTYPDGSRYQGGFEDDLFSGRGEYSFEDGSKYNGKFKKGMFDGFGVLTYADGSVYEGEFSQDLPHGKGVLRSKDGTVFEGQFERGKRNGQGRLTQPDGQIYEGIFANDQYLGE